MTHTACPDARPHLERPSAGWSEAAAGAGKRLAARAQKPVAAAAAGCRRAWAAAAGRGAGVPWVDAVQRVEAENLAAGTPAAAFPSAAWGNRGAGLQTPGAGRLALAAAALACALGAAAWAASCPAAAGILRQGIQAVGPLQRISVKCHYP